MKIEKKCTQCEIIYFTYPSNIKNTTTNFCGYKCYGLWQRSKNFAQQNKKVRPRGSCTIADCCKILKGHGYCSKHYYRFIERFARGIKSKIKVSSIVEFDFCNYCSNPFIGVMIKGKTPKYCSHICSGLGRKKPYILKKGYKKILKYDHPRSDKKGYVFQHIVVMEEHLGRPIVFPEEIHHIDHDRGNNNIDNLMLFACHRDHMEYHKLTPK